MQSYSLYTEMILIHGTTVPNRVPNAYSSYDV